MGGQAAGGLHSKEGPVMSSYREAEQGAQPALCGSSPACQKPTCRMLLSTAAWIGLNKVDLVLIELAIAQRSGYVTGCHVWSELGHCTPQGCSHDQFV